MMQPPPGYDGLQLVGVGATSRVFSARDTRTGRRVALKRLHRQLLRSDDALARLRREYEALSRLRHPSVVTVRDVLRWQGHPTVVMDFVPGEDLKERLQRTGPLESSTAENIARQLLDVLIAVHGSGIVHRDIKPQNVRITEDDRVYLLDFGSARFDAASELTATGTSVGTPEYMAPELFAGSVYDPRVDIYGLGATLFEVLTGRPPHRAATLTQLAFKRTRERAPLVRGFRADVGAGIAQLVDRALQIAPDDRFASAALARWALDNPPVELSFRKRRRQHPPCLHCHTRIPGRCAVCPSCGSDHPFAYAAGSSHVVVHGVRAPQRLLDWVTRRFPERTTRDHLVHLMERVAASEWSSQRFTSFIDEVEAQQLARELEAAGVQCEVVSDQGTAGWRQYGYALALFGIAFLAFGRWVLGVEVGLGHVAVLVGPALLAIGFERLFAVLRSEQGILSSGRYPAAVLPADRATLGLTSVGFLTAGTLCPVVGGAAASGGSAALATVLTTLSMPLLVGAAAFAAAAGVAWWASFASPLDSAKSSPEPNLWQKVARALSIPPLRRAKRFGTSVAVALVATVVALVPIELASLAAMDQALKATTAAVRPALAASASGPNFSEVPTPTGSVQTPKPSVDVAPSPRVKPAATPRLERAAAVGKTSRPEWPFGLVTIFVWLASLSGLRLLSRRRRVDRDARALVRRWVTEGFRSRRGAERTIGATADAVQFAVARRRLPESWAPADRIAEQAAPTEFLRAARTRFTDLAHCLSADAAAQLEDAVEALAARVKDRGVAERSVLARTIVESDPEQGLKLELLALEGEMEVEAAERWFARRAARRGTSAREPPPAEPPS